MGLYARTKKEFIFTRGTSIRGEIDCTQYEDDYGSTTYIYHKDRQIGTIQEECDQIDIDGDFDIKETGFVDNEGIPEIINNGISISLADLMMMHDILRTCNQDDLDTDIWEIVK